MDVAQVEAKVSEKTKARGAFGLWTPLFEAIICVHTYHFPVDMEWVSS